MTAAHEFTVDPHEFDGSRVLVTGGSKGVGQAVVARMREAGARVLTPTRRGPCDLPDANLFVGADITTAACFAAVVHAAHERLGGIDIIVHALGGSTAPFGSGSPERECRSPQF